MNKRILLTWLTVISMISMTFPISQALAQGSAASFQSKTSSELSHLVPKKATTNLTWRAVPSPNLSTSYNQLDAVTTVSGNDVWTVGSYNNSNDVGLTLTEHWNGNKWSSVASPNLSPYANELEGVAAVSTNDIWAVGYYETSPGQAQRLIEHWNGTGWRIVPNPEHKGGLFGVAAVSANDVWAVGAGAFGDGSNTGIARTGASSPAPILGWVVCFKVW